MAYLDSTKIKVFPSVDRNATFDGDAELMSEGNISNIVRSLCRERKSYVLSKEWKAPFEFVIYGFYFKIIDVNSDSLAERPLYAHIKIDEKTNGNYQFLTLINPANSETEHTLKLDEVTETGDSLDKEGEFQGIWFDNQDSGGTHTLQLLDDSGNIPATSLLHVKTNEILNAGENPTYINDSFTTGTLNTTTLNSTTINNAGTISTKELHSTASVNFDSSLEVDGITTLNNSLSVKGKTTLSGSVDATGQTITASTFIGKLSGNADTASTFNSNRTVTLTGPITGTSTSNNGVHTISTTITSSAVTSEKIANAAVTSAKIADGAVTSAKIVDGAVTSAKIVDGAVTSAKIVDGAGAVTSAKIVDGAVTNDDIANNTIKTEKLRFGVTMTLTVNNGVFEITTPSLKNN